MVNMAAFGTFVSFWMSTLQQIKRSLEEQTHLCLDLCDALWRGALSNAAGELSLC